MPDREVPVVRGRADVIGPDLARDVGQEAGAVTLAIHRAGAVMQRDQPVQREIEEVARRPTVLAGNGHERASVVLLDHR